MLSLSLFGNGLALIVYLPLLVCSARVIFECDLMQDFLNSSGMDNGSASQGTPPQDRKCNLRVLLPTRSVCTVSVRDNSRTGDVFEVKDHHMFCVRLHI